MKRESYWLNSDTGLWDVTDTSHVILLSRLWVNVLRVSDAECTVLLRGVLPKAGSYLSSLYQGHTFHVTWDECGSPENYGRPVVVVLKDCSVIDRWVDELVNSSSPADTAMVHMCVLLSCDVEFFFDGEGEHVR